MYSTENSSESLNHDTRGSFSFPPQLVLGLKRPTTNAFLFSVLKCLECDHEKPRGDAVCVVLLVPPVPPSKRNWLKGYFSMRREKDHPMCLWGCALHTLAEDKSITLLLACCKTDPKQPRSSHSLSPECLDHVVFNHCDP